MERMTDYKPQERQDLEELYRKQNVRIYELEEENRTLREKLSEITMVADDEKQSIEHILELEEENKKLKAEKDKLYIDYENLSNCNADLIQENKKLKEIIRKNVNGCPYGGFYCSQYLGL